MGNSELIRGKYKLIKKIAHGGMSEIFLGMEKGDSNDGRMIIIKSILPDLAKDPQIVGMFINEAQLAAQMNHPNIVKVFDFGEYGGRLYMIMEMVDGLDCWRFMRTIKKWDKDTTTIAIWIVSEILSGLEYVHDMRDVNGNPIGVVHRDLSPSNIYLSRTGSVKLGDFGIAKIKSSRFRRLSVIPRGKFGYIAPEQVSGGKLDKRADIFSSGVVLTELIIGKKIFDGHSQLSVLLNIKEARLDVLDQNVDKIDPELIPILKKALRKSPDDRYENAAIFKKDLEKYMLSKGSTFSREEFGKFVHRASTTDEDFPESKKKDSIHTAKTDPRSFESDKDGKRDSWDDIESVVYETTTPNAIEPLMFEETPITREIVENKIKLNYEYKTDRGQKAGPVSYAQIIKLIFTDKILPDTLISENGGDFIPASDFPELVRHMPLATTTTDLDEPMTPDRRGLLQLESCSQVALSLCVKNETGMLVCEDGKKRKENYFVDGHPVYVTSNNSDELLGEILVKKGILEKDELDFALNLLPNFNGHLGDALIVLGILSAVDLYEHINDQITMRFVELLKWKKGQYEFYKNAKSKKEALEIPLNTFEIIRETLLDMSKKVPVTRSLSQVAYTKISPSRDIVELCFNLAFPAELDEVMRSLKSPCTFDDLVVMSGKERKDKPTLIKAFYLAAQTGIWEVDGPAPSLK